MVRNRGQSRLSNKPGWVLAAGVLALLLLQEARACTCLPQNVAESKRAADAVFVGTVDAVDVVDTETKREPRIVVTFSVARVWKGKVGKTFQMHTSYEFSSCGGFPRELAQPGNTLLVYAHGIEARHWKANAWSPPSNAGSASLMGDPPAGVNRALLDAVKDGDTVYTTNICTRTANVEYAADDFAQLGKYTEFAQLDSEPSMAFLESLQPIDNGLPAECTPFNDARAWAPVRDRSKMAELVKVLESSLAYRSIPYPRPAKYNDHWVVNSDGHIGMCRVSMSPDVVCGEATVEFIRVGNGWATGESRVSTYCK